MTTHPYSDAAFALLTLHEKGQLMAPLLHDVFGATLTVVDTFDTDTLGTFTRDVPREGTQLEAARRKAHLAAELSGLRLGLGSEGSFGAGPIGFGCWNLELVVLVDVDRGLEIIGRAHEPGQHHHATLTSLDQLAAFAATARFPEHGLALRPDNDADPRLRKGLRTWEQLTSAFVAAQAESSSGEVFVENELRAHLNPTRQAVIRKASEDLVRRAAACCPACASPGFGPASTVSGLPCRWCGEPTQVIRAVVHGCVSCSFTREEPRAGDGFAEPSHCDACNP